MRLLNKFYSFIKSIYLNNSKYSNNLRHTLRIFFEREVKTKHTPTLFGTTFKGSKWVDYQTLNINKLFIKSGLSYFYYIISAIFLTFFLLGRSKSEQYFGFFPFFTYINFILGYIPLLCNDFFSQAIVIFYIVYTLLIKYLNFLIGRLGSNLLPPTTQNLLKNRSSTSNTTNSGIGKTLTGFFNSFAHKPISKTSTSVSNFSKNLSLSSQNILIINSNALFNGLTRPSQTFISGNFLHSTVRVKKLKDLSLGKTLTSSEAYYSLSNSLRNLKVSSSNLNLNSIYRMSTLHKSLTFFNFNIENNLNISKQQRWLVKNSLLSESIVPNSFLITQVKKLLGSGILDKDFTNKSLWLPTKSAQLSSTESTLYLNNLNSQLFKGNALRGFLQTNSLNQTNFNNLNFFENSRLWLFKKYFFSNSQGQNIIVDYPHNPQTLLKSNTSFQSENIKFTTNLYINNLAYFLKNHTTPSLYVAANSDIVPKSTGLNVNTFSKLDTPQLDIITGGNLHFFSYITSNTKNPTNSNTSTTYFKTLPTELATLPTSVKFYK